MGLILNTMQKTFVGMVLFGILMGAVFPFITSRFINFKHGMAFYFDAACIIAGVVIGVSCFYLTKLIIFRKIDTIARALKDIAQGEGNLTKRLSFASTDSIGQLSNQFNGLMEKLQSMIKELSNNSTPLFTSAEAIAQTTTDLSMRADGMTGQSESVTIASGDAAKNVANIANCAEEMSQAVNTAAAAIEEMSASINEVAKNCQNESQIVASADDQAKSTHDSMERLRESSNEIGKIVEMINDIADQTNLLALNATIEAASAGDAGKGFAVVANEVKELAKQTAQATEQIGRQVEGMQNNAGIAITAIGNISRIIGEVHLISRTIVSAVEQQSAAINEISKSVGSAGEAAKHIADDVSQSSIGLSDISVNIEKVNASAKQSAAEANGVNEKIMQMTIFIANLQRTIKKFKV